MNESGETTIVFVFLGGIVTLTFLLAFGVFSLSTSFILLFLFAVTVGIGGNYYRRRKAKDHARKLEGELSEVESFSPTKKQAGFWGLIAIDDNKKQIAIKEHEGAIVIYSYNDILSCEIVEDGETVYQKSRTIGRSIVGGVIAGGAGAVIGGLSGKTKEKKEIKSLVLRVVFKSTNKPIVKLGFIDAERSKEKVDLSQPYYAQLYKEALDSVKDWKDTFEIIIDSVNSEKEGASNSYSSVSDELLKLNDLKEKGILTADEFEQQKRKLLS